MKKRLLSLILALSAVIVFSCCFTAFAAGDTDNQSDISELISNLPEVTDKSGAEYYYYYQLTDAEKAIYWALSKATLEDSYVVFTGVSEDLYSSSNDFYNSVDRAYNALRADNPMFQLYWYTYGVSYSSNIQQGVVYLYPQPCGSEYLISKAAAGVDWMVDTIGSEGDRYTRIREIIDFLYSEVDYDYQYEFYESDRKMYSNHTLLGGVIEGYMVCEGYAELIKVLCDRLEIPCIYVENYFHAWNMIQMDDGYWYLVDGTYDSLFESGYYLMGENTQYFKDDYRYHEDGWYLGEEGLFLIPDLAADSYVYNGTFNESYHDVSLDFTEPAPKFLYTVNSDGVTCTITGYEGKQSGDLIIPETLDGYTVTHIGDSAFYYCGGFTGDLVIPDTVLEIGVGAFDHCTGLKGSLTLSKNFETIGKGAFLNNSGLTGEVAFPESLSTIGDRAFFECSGLTGDIKLSATTVLGSHVFTNCSGFDGTMYLPDSVEWSTYLISGTNLSAIKVYETNPNYVVYENILYTKDMKTLLYCPSGRVGDVVIPVGVEVIVDRAFADAYKENEGTLTLPEGLKSIGNCAFEYTCFVGDLIIPDSVTSIGSDAFIGSTFNGKLVLSNGLTEIPAQCFSSTQFTGDLIIPDSVRSIAALAFYDVPFGGELHISSSIETIGEFAFGFYGEGTATSFTNELDLSKSDVVIGDSAFGGRVFPDFRCNCDSEHIVNSYEPGCYHTGYYTDYCTYCGGYTYKEYGMTGHNYVFLGTTNGITSCICSSCHSIIECKYDIIESDNKIWKKNDETPVIINTNGDISTLQRVTVNGKTLPDTAYDLTSIGISISADYLKTLDVGTNTVILYYSDGIALSHITVFESEGKCGDDIYWELGNDGTLRIYGSGDMYDFIGTDVPWYYCRDKITSVTLSEGITGIGDNLFSGCTAISKITLPSTLTRIGESAFLNCSNLSSITFGENLKELSDSSFGACYDLTEITFLGDAPEFGSDVFAYVEASVNYPPENKTWTSDKLVDHGGSLIWVGSSTSIEYTVVFKDWDGAIISEKTYHYGDTIEVPADPVRDADNTYIYFFTGWDKDLVITCEGNATYTATYTSGSIVYTVTFKNWNGDVISEQTYNYGDKIYVPADPVRADDNTYSYAFTGWDKDVTECTGNTIYIAQFESRYIEYSVIFKNWNGDIISEKTYHYGDKIDVPADPVREDDNTCSYTFTGWDKDVTDCVGNAIYTAQFESGNISYSVIFKNWNGDIISEKTYHYGDTVEIPADPVREDDNTYTYTFAGWDMDITTCVGDATYTATFTSKHIIYTVIFKNWDGAVISEQICCYGDKIVVPADPTREDDNTFTYTFAGWGKDITACEGNATYTATFTSEYIVYTVVFKNWDGTVISEQTCHYGDTVEVPSDPVKESEDIYNYTFAGWDKDITTCVGNATYTATFTSKHIIYTVIFKNWDGAVISEQTCRYGDKIEIPADPVREEDNVYSYIFAGWDSEVTDCTGNTIYNAQFERIYIEYTVLFKNWNGNIISEKTYHYGDKVDIPAAPVREEDDTYSYTFTGWDNEVTDCTSKAIYVAQFESRYIEYSVIFKNWNGNIISEKTYHYGDKVDIPASPTKEQDGNGSYAFIGWDLEVTELCKGNAIYTAEFTIFVYGDVTGDGKINALDLIRLQKYLSGADVALIKEAADVTVDGNVNVLDLIRLKMFLAGADVILGQ